MLEELVMGKPLVNIDEPAAQTKEAYECIARELKHLRELEMREPTLRELDICTHLVIQLGTESVTTCACC